MICSAGYRYGRSVGNCSGFDSGCNFYDRDIVASEVDMVTVKLLLVL